MYNWYEKIWCWLTGKCCWCKSREYDTMTFKGNHKYTDLTICNKCFNKKWDSLNFDLTKNIDGVYGI